MNRQISTGRFSLCRKFWVLIIFISLPSAGLFSQESVASAGSADSQPLAMEISAENAGLAQAAPAESPVQPEPAEAATPPAHKPFPLDEALAVLGAELRWDPLFRAGVLAASGHYLAFQAGNSGAQSLSLMDNKDLFKLPAPYLDGGNLYFPGEFVSFLKNTLDNYRETELSRFRIAAIIVDPGHGGKDQGASGTHTVKGKQFTLVEKDVTLRVSRDLYSMLRTAYPDKQVLMTRTGDTFPTLEDRVVIANSVPLKENEAIVFISVHANASFNKAARGYEVWYLSPNYRRTVIDESKYADSQEVLHILNDMLEEEFTTESIVMAQLIMNQFKENLGSLIPGRGIKEEEWFVVKNARMPSVLVELGFVTNETDALLMTDENYLQKLSQTLYKGINQFVTMFERSGGFTAIE
ncbi:N-acetylmuramoyl-L-alanine amidase, family 3 [Treponema primitia ZAS-2]|uniref:N-acetylmuramoyl-L-alanine amidase n=1 Tax=Treponema primitia (strain ATCC BAA-887 / DSM 12427 / ZAS-2) TaxID=545694 RepID=F5YH43_TREPZ|nr:N-acetylmuramoyl-L-alanine amidase [Treponema primitia]AEF84763.1 N-acetylmuramoyl-L-alanine amidase, family 3 [Treponema primitia ZAS-2]